MAGTGPLYFVGKQRILSRVDTTISGDFPRHFQRNATHFPKIFPNN